MRKAEAGFSLVELMVAMVVTLIIVGSMFGLLTSGQGAFKVQPERSDRQQNIRAAMDLIMRDIGAAGIGMPPFMQVFSPGMNNIGPATAPGGGLTDQITTLANTEGFDNELACKYPGGHASHVFMASKDTNVVAGSPVIIILTDGTWTIRVVTSADDSANSSSAGDCDDGSGGKGPKHADLDFSPGAKDPVGINTPAGVCAVNSNPALQFGTAYTSSDCAIQYISSGDFIAYRVNNGSDGVPNLERNVNAQGWQILARGIENMQVQYVRADGAVSDNAPTVVNNNYDSIITQVRVTLAARSQTTGKLQGATTASNAPMAIRGSLVSQASPRMALWVLAQDTVSATPKWN